MLVRSEAEIHFVLLEDSTSEGGSDHYPFARGYNSEYAEAAVAIVLDETHVSSCGRAGRETRDLELNSSLNLSSAANHLDLQAPFFQPPGQGRASMKNGLCRPSV